MVSGVTKLSLVLLKVSSSFCLRGFFLTVVTSSLLIRDKFLKVKFIFENYILQKVVFLMILAVESAMQIKLNRIKMCNAGKLYITIKTLWYLTAFLEISSSTSYKLATLFPMYCMNGVWIVEDVAVSHTQARTRLILQREIKAAFVKGLIETVLCRPVMW